MEKIIKKIALLLEQGIQMILEFLTLIWTWSFGQIIAIFQSNWQTLPLWKLIILLLICATISYLLYGTARQIWGALEGVFKAFIGLLSAFVTALPYIITAGIVAFAGSWAIQTLNF